MVVHVLPVAVEARQVSDEVFVECLIHRVDDFLVYHCFKLAGKEHWLVIKILEGEATNIDII